MEMEKPVPEDIKLQGNARHALVYLLPTKSASIASEAARKDQGYWFLKRTLVNIELKLRNEVKTQDIGFPWRRKGRAARCSETVLGGTQEVSIPVYGAALSREYWEDPQCVGHWE